VRDLESMLRDGMLKILLQQYLPIPEVGPTTLALSSARANTVGGTELSDSHLNEFKWRD
jgi:hypothetical protein